MALDFFFAVKSTGVYCRPCCPARRPGREQVEFFDSADAAESAGYRACLRCQPRELPIAARKANIVSAIRAYLDGRAEEKIALAEIGEAVNLNPMRAQRMFKEAMGVTPHAYLRARRLGRLKSEMKNGSSVTTALFDAGYGSSSRLYENASARLGMTPSVYRKGAPGMRIVYDIAACYLGKVLAAATDRGICSVQLGDSEAALKAALAEEFPGARLERDPEEMRIPLEKVVAAVEGRLDALSLPLDLQATSFELRVWEGLRAIPPGERRSYSEIAREIGQPQAARAVARACAANPVAVLIPCHRVVRRDGAMGGYRWSEERKRKLLERECVTIKSNGSHNNNSSYGRTRRMVEDSVAGLRRSRGQDRAGGAREG
jgi:AraC family transcriptional regulator, regulatory protein of adaptative response / methylated-DNA-[protein]-cysteine methyltransferase